MPLVDMWSAEACAAAIAVKILHVTLTLQARIKQLK